jgi:adenylate cyclase
VGAAFVLLKTTEIDAHISRRYLGRICSPPHDFAPKRSSAAEDSVEKYFWLRLREIEMTSDGQYYFVGREPELAQLEGYLTAAIAGQGQTVLVTGEAGIGKTFLIERFLALTVACYPQVRIAQGRCSELFGQGEGYLPFIEALSMLLADKDQKSVREKVLAILSDTAPSWLEAIPAVGKWLKVSWETAQAVRTQFGLGAGTRVTAPDQERMLQEYAGVLTRLAQESPLLLFLDDLQWSDNASVDLLVHLSRRIRGSPILILGTYRSSDVDVGRDGQPHPLRRAVQEMHRYNACQEMSLARLERHECTALITAEFPHNDFPTSFLDFLFYHSGGNALFITEMLRYLRDQGLMQRCNGTWHLIRSVESVHLPRSVESIVTMRIDRLEEHLRRALQCASVEGERFLSTPLARVLEVDELVLEERLGLAERVHRFIRTKGDLEIGWELATLYEFAHVLFQKALYDGLQPKQRLLLHRRTGLALEELYGQAADEIASQLTLHFTEGRVFDKALDYSLVAGREAQRLYAPREAIGHYERAQSLLERVGGGDREQQLAIEEGLGDMQTMLAEHDAALAHYERARNLLATVPEASERLAGLCRKTAMLYERKGEYDTAFQWLEQGLGALGSEAILEMARLRLAGAGVYLRQGKHLQARERCESALEIARQGGGQAELAHGTQLLGVIHDHLGDSAEAMTCAQRSLALYEEMGDLVGQAKALNNLGIACTRSGDWTAAIGYFRRGIELEEQLGDVHGVANLTNSLGEILLSRGNLDAAAGAYQKSLDIWEAVGFPIGVALCWSNLGKVCIERGGWDQALDYLERSQRRFEEIESELFLPEVYWRLALVHLGLGQLEEARQLGERSVGLATELGMGLEKGISLRVMGQVHLAFEEWEQAEEALTASLSILEEQDNRYRMGETLYHLGRLYQAMARAGDPEAVAKAESALGRARAIFQELGAERDLAQVKEVLK